MIVDRDRNVAALSPRCHGADKVLRAPQSHSILPEPAPIRCLPFPWYVARWWGIVLCTAYTVGAVTPLILLVALRTSSDHPSLMEAGVDIALVGFTVLSLQFVLAGRIACIEGPFGLDRLMRFHRAMGIVAAALLLAHPLLLIPNFGLFLLSRVRVHWYLWMGRFGAIILLLLVLTALFRRVVPFRYETWRRLHAAAALVLLTMGVLHSLAIGDDLTNTRARVLWLAVAVMGSGAWGYSRLIRPILLRAPRRPHLFAVESVRPEAPNVWTVTLSRVAKRTTSPFNYAPGQFVFIRIHRESRWSEEHPFTIASSPARNEEICLTIKGCGDFTSHIGLVQKRALTTIHGPFGRFSHLFHPEQRDLIFIAAGIGITPHISMLRYIRDTLDPRRVLLLYASRREADILFGQELMEMERDGFPNLSVVHILSEPTRDWRGESGRLDADRVMRLYSCPAERSLAIRCRSTDGLGNTATSDPLLVTIDTIVSKGGNVLEWNETSVTSMTRGERGGDWDYIEFGLRASVRISDRPTYGFGGKGFRVAAAVVPEPSAALMAFAALASLGNLPRPRK